uniref:Uncharacterized protein n=1 Tax=Lactuca sativa TaxID=4236 RepID=A0A9R1UY72_LACSA|nr:hypothetical protein LSAT_V11C700358900 [Lactuca sativa]
MSVTRNDDDDASSSSSSSRKKLRTFCNNGVASWLDVNHDMLFFNYDETGICKSWRSFTVSNRNTFMASKPPMKISIGPLLNKEDSYYFLEEFKERRFKTIFPHSFGRTYFGSTCGYLILFDRETRDF